MYTLHASGLFGMPIYFLIPFFMGMAIFAVCFVFTISVFVRNARAARKNNAAPRVPVPAKVVAKRSTFHNSGGSGMGYTTNYVTFEYSSGDRQEFVVPPQMFGLLVEGDEGTLTIQGTAFVGFERNAK